jgi:hypothetical protein
MYEKLKYNSATTIYETLVLNVQWYSLANPAVENAWSSVRKNRRNLHNIAFVPG